MHSDVQKRRPTLLWHAGYGELWVESSSTTNQEAKGDDHGKHEDPGRSRESGRGDVGPGGTHHSKWDEGVDIKNPDLQPDEPEPRHRGRREPMARAEQHREGPI